MVVKVQNCSTWNKLISVLCVFCVVLISCIFPLVSVSAGAVAVPVSAELIGQLLVALGLMAGNATEGYSWVGSDNPYVDSIFEQQVKSITNGVPIAGEDLKPLAGTVIPNDLYTTDGNNFYVGNKSVTASDLFLQAKALVGASYDMPVNITGLLPGVVYNEEVGYHYKYGRIIPPSGDLGKDNYFVPYYTTAGFKSFVWRLGVKFSSAENGNIITTGYRFIKQDNAEVGQTFVYNAGTPFLKYLFVPVWIYAPGTATGGSQIYTDNTLVTENIHVSDNYVWNSTMGASPVRVSGLGDWDWGEITGVSLLQTSGVPTTELSGDSNSLGNTIVQVKPNNDDDNDGSTPPAPQSPNNWEIWQTVTDLIKQIDTGEITNGGTSYQQYVNNNYNYVDVDINVPDTIHNDVELSGGLEITGNGDININITEDISLPSGGDGSGFFNPDATDVVDALGKNNPVVSVISGVFSAIDPALLGIFSVSVSLMLVLGLWKLIRG